MLLMPQIWSAGLVGGAGRYGEPKAAPEPVLSQPMNMGDPLWQRLPMHQRYFLRNDSQMQGMLVPSYTHATADGKLARVRLLHGSLGGVRPHKHPILNVNRSVPRTACLHCWP
jgi:hypothetical protein